MRPTAVFVVIAVLSLGLVAVSAKTASAPQNDSERIAATVSGPDKGQTASSAEKAASAESAAQPSKKDLKNSKVAQKPKLQDPN